MWIGELDRKEAVHMLGAVFDEAIAVLLGWEIDARLILAGHKRHRASLYRCLRDSVFHASYLKAESLDYIERWQGLVYKFYGDEITQEMIDKNIKHFKKGEQEDFFGGRLSDYSVVPYCSLKGAIKNKNTFAVEEYEYFEKKENEKIDISALIQIWNQVTI